MANGSSQLPKEVLHAVLDYLCTGRESYWAIMFRYSPRQSVQEKDIQYIEGQENWQSILSISLVSKRLRELCLERIFGTVVLKKMKKIGQLWKLLEVNPGLGTLTHTCHLEYFCHTVDWSYYPSQTMPIAFGSRLDSVEKQVEALYKEADRQREVREERKTNGYYERRELELQNHHQDGSEDSDSEDNSDIESCITVAFDLEVDLLKAKYAKVGPDGTGIDENIKNALDLEKALTFIFSKWTRLQSLNWETSQIPTFTTVINALAAHGSLQSLDINLGACDEDFLTGSSLNSPSPPIWLLAPSLRRIRISSPTRSHASLERQDRQLRAAVKILQHGSRLDQVVYVGYLGSKPDSEEGEEANHNDTFQGLSQDQAIKQLLPLVASISSTEASIKSEEGFEVPNHRLFSCLRRIHAEKTFQPLEKEDVLELGKLAKDEENHELKGLSDYLLDEEVAEEMARIWNERHQVAVV